MQAFITQLSQTTRTAVVLQTANGNLFFIFICARSDSRFEEFVADR